MQQGDESKDAIQAGWPQQLCQGLEKMQCSLSPAQQQQLLDYLGLLTKWNRVFNLTAVRDPQEMVSRQLLDSLAILPWVKGRRVLDVGTGAGLPGIPLAIALPDMAFTLLDSNGKKTRFVQQAAAQLGLQNVSVAHTRIESLQEAAGFDVITSRAFASLGDFLGATARLLAEGGVWLAMKGQIEPDEAGMPPGVSAQWHPLLVPGTRGQRHLVECRQDPPASAP